MKIQKTIILTLLVMAVLLSACGPTQVQKDATATQVAMEIASTQTAQAPTATATSTPTLTPTNTPIPTATATATPLPTSTPTITPTPQPELMAASLTKDDLSEGFVEAPPEFIEESLANMPDGTYGFAYADEVNAQAIFGFLIPAKNRAEQAAYDASMPSMVEGFLAGVGAGPDYESLYGYEEIGDSRNGLTAVSPDTVLPMRWDALAFRRGEVVALLIVCYPDGDEPVMSMLDFAFLMDGRIQTYLTAGSAY